MKFNSQIQYIFESQEQASSTGRIKNKKFGLANKMWKITLLSFILRKQKIGLRSERFFVPHN